MPSSLRTTPLRPPSAFADFRTMKALCSSSQREVNGLSVLCGQSCQTSREKPIKLWTLYRLVGQMGPDERVSKVLLAKEILLLTKHWKLATWRGFYGRNGMHRSWGTVVFYGREMGSEGPSQRYKIRECGHLDLLRSACSTAISFQHPLTFDFIVSKSKKTELNVHVLHAVLVTLIS